MKKIIYCILLGIIIYSDVNAQDKISVPSLDETAAITMDTLNKKLLVKKGIDAKSFSIEKSNGKWHFADRNTSEIYSLLGIDSTAINSNGIPTTPYLMDLAFASPNHKLILESNNSNEGPREELVTPSTTTDADTAYTWFLPTIIGLVGLGAGFFIGKSLRKTTAIVENNHNTKETAVQAERPFTPNDDKALKTLQKDYKKLEQEFQQYKMNDAKVNQHLFETVVIPLDQAIKAGDKALVGKLIFQAAIILSSMTRHKAQKKLGYDEHNINVLLQKNIGLTDKYETITRMTATDKTPKHIQVVVDLLKNMGVNGLDEYIFQGYYIKDINA